MTLKLSQMKRPHWVKPCPVCGEDVKTGPFWFELARDREDNKAILVHDACKAAYEAGAQRLPKNDVGPAVLAERPSASTEPPVRLPMDEVIELMTRAVELEQQIWEEACKLNEAIIVATERLTDVILWRQR